MLVKKWAGICLAMFFVNAFAAYNYFDVNQCINSGRRMCFTIFTLALSAFSPIAEFVFDNFLFWLDGKSKFLAMNVLMVIVMNIFVVLLIFSALKICRKIGGRA